MSYRLFAILCLALSVAFAGFSAVQGQDKVQKKDEKKDEKTEDKKDEAKEDEKPLTKEEFDALMEEIKTSWNKLKINARKKMGDKAAENADEISKVSDKILRYDGEVLKGDQKGKKARDQKDFQDWVAALKKAAEDYAKHARKSDWDKAEAAKDRINETCGDCHDLYEPVDGE